MRFCCINFCENNNRNKQARGLSIFRFDASKGEKKDWLNIINSVKGQCIRKNKKFHYICQHHFDEAVIFKKGKCCRLLDNAIPTIFPVEGEYNNRNDPLNIIDYLEPIKEEYLETIQTTEQQTSLNTIDNSASFKDDYKCIETNAIQTIQYTSDIEIGVERKQHSSSENISANSPEGMLQSRYPGDIDIKMACQNPKTALNALSDYKIALNTQRNRVRTLNQNKGRQEKKIKVMRLKIAELENKISVSQNAILHIKDINNWTSSELIKELRTGLHGPFKAELRAFVTRVLLSLI